MGVKTIRAGLEHPDVLLQGGGVHRLRQVVGWVCLMA
jgi:hypothetical protein